MKKTIEDLMAESIQRQPPPPYQQQQPVGALTIFVVLSQQRPQSRTKGSVRTYAPVLKDAGVDQEA